MGWLLAQQHTGASAPALSATVASGSMLSGPQLAQIGLVKKPIPMRANGIGPGHQSEENRKSRAIMAPPDEPEVFHKWATPSELSRDLVAMGDLTRWGHAIL